MFHALRLKYKEKSLKQHGEKDFYKVTKMDNTDGLCLSIQWESVDAERVALDMADCAWEYVLTFAPDEHDYANEETESLIKSYLDKARMIADTFKKASMAITVLTNTKNTGVRLTKRICSCCKK